MRDDDLALLVEEYFSSGAARQDMEAIAMQIGMKVIRKADLRIPCTAFGILESIRGTKATVRWTYNGRQQHSTLALSALVEVSSEMEQDIRAKAKARYAAMKTEQVASYEPAPWSDEMQAQHEEEWSNADDQFIRPAVDLDRQASALLDEIYGQEF